ncbi:zinc finger lsd1 subclass family protein (macronuclear) [Tetrahymena thermophila SB210]|uniref:Zinc finger lsd1 subclass family protein n=1 Tax=Tetrahymena thermophila (strain SB210) TaxID=312017 RepID=Q228Z0_TETTS|nr:zinc finger lsd1 subclass family protein [Tetrahymena thermophila SB210]EAR81858.2 zinc finger lsd1 subclass family protein [Tetrahymena thermophila SB210]|eukprot:XP_001029521.2 zinc finger lsd1 subclass family protein [Tetrahymena thermophila SB210]
MSCQLICDKSCEQCSTPNDPNGCISCHQGSYLSAQNQCLSCDQPCLSCQNSSNFCTLCPNGYQLDENNKCIIPQCPSGCQTCNLQNNNTVCISCNDQYYLDENKNCQKCQLPCQTCTGSAYSCTSCQDQNSYVLNSSNNTCQLKCQNNCSSCNYDNGQIYCIQCNPGYYIDSSSSCQQCISPCSSCKITASTCLSCIDNYVFVESNNSCSPICDSSCKTCSNPKDTQSCLSCFDGSFLDNNNQCQKCISPCQNCNQKGSNCLSCIQDYTFNATQNTCQPICDSSCNLCSLPLNSQSCLSCFDGFYLSNNQCFACQYPCATCLTSSSNCLTCQKDYIYQQQTNSCSPICYNSCKTCSLPLSSSSCLSCYDGFFLNNNNECQICQPPCQNCVISANTCQSCIQNYTLNVTQSLCFPICDPPCLTCNQPKNSSACLSCIDGFFLFNNQCLNCQSPCASCIDSSSNCLSCIENYTFIQSQNYCSPNCDPSCKTCSSPNNNQSCLSCDDGFYLTNDQCIQCQFPCLTCQNQSNNCQSCSVNYILDTLNNQCQPICDQTCKSCLLPLNSSSCLSCYEGFFFSNNQCLPCIPPCQTCQNSQKNCLSCEIGYNYNPLTNYCDPICDQTCQSCSLPYNKNACLSCFDGNFLLNNQCIPCQPPCLSCSNLSTCLSCQSSYIFNSDTNSCSLICPILCTSCQMSDLKVIQCLSCQDGFYVSQYQCLACQTPCKTCQGKQTNCLSCIENYTYSPSLNLCSPICDPSCKSCYSPYNSQSCLTCFDGDYLLNNECLSCQLPCKSCQNSSQTCLSCIDNYTFNQSTFDCSPVCDQSCYTCSYPLDSSSCLSCYNGFYLSNKQCLPCDSECSSCQITANNCTQCSDNYIFDEVEEVCLPICAQTCKTCTLPLMNNQCSSCFDGYYLNNYSCVPCQSPCQNCIDQSNCLSCLKDYSYNQQTNQCNLICPDLCQQCQFNKDNQIQCLVCIDGFYLNNQSCLKCSSPCLTCQFSSNNCLSCDSNYTFSNGLCLPNCDPKCKTCTLPNLSSACLTCQDGYYFDNNYCFPCQQPCQNCQYSPNNCLSCITNYIFNTNSNSCSPICDVTCQTCSLPNNNLACLSCFDGYFLNSNQCIPCDSSCAKCQITSTNCIQCAKNYLADNQSNTCSPICDPLCKTCVKPLNKNSCLSCFDQYYLFNDECLQCSPPCLTCINTNLNCLSCIDNYIYNDSSNQCLPNCPQNCQNCTPNNIQSNTSSENSNFFICIQCQDGYFLDQNKNCQNCQQPCLNCQNQATNCTKCIQNYQLNAQNNLCIPQCDISCSTCSLPYDLNSCLSCFDGFYLKSGQCLQCTQPCKSCQFNDTYCTSCIQYYGLNSATNSCYLLCPIGCKECNNLNNQSSCISCIDGYYLTNGQCLPCQSPCSTCENDAQNCLTCIKYYKLVSDSQRSYCSPVCDISCQTCTAPNDFRQCMSCIEGYYLYQNSCLSCSFPCQSCEGSPSNCLSCVQWHSLDPSSNTCNLTCPTECTSCFDSSSKTICQECIDGYYLSEGVCKQCQFPCQNCLNVTSCFSCQENYTYDEQNQTCNPICHSSCKTCSFPKKQNACLECNDGYFLAKNRCIPCSSSCATCDTTGNKCLTCAEGYVYSSIYNSCQFICNPSCKTCLPESPNSCLTCKTGYYQIGNMCIKCESPCATCADQSTNCLSCITNYVYDQITRTCFPQCFPTCSACITPNNNFSCTKCKDGYYLSAFNQCLPCSPPCLTCSINANKCLSCIETYKFDSQFKICMIICDSSCATCTQPLKSTSCSSCNDQRVLINNQCLPCQPPCATCAKTTTNCTSCLQNYTLNPQTNTCKSLCHQNCKTCLHPYSDTSCSSCYDGYYLNNINQCLQCQSPCQNCQKVAIQCKSCIDGYILNQSTLECVLNCDKSCKTCFSPQNSNACTSCPDGFYLINNSCKNCDFPCQTCQISPQECLSCFNNYKLENVLKQCTPICDISCKSCYQPQDPSQCIECAFGYFLNSQNKCQICESPCSSCVDNPSNCISCLETYYSIPLNGICIKMNCDETCFTCSKDNDRQACIKCKEGFVKLGNLCEKCESPCQACIQSQIQCTSCIANYKLKKNKCYFNCHSSCNTCQNQSPQEDKCTSCFEGYFLDGNQIGRCVKCNQNCAICSNFHTCLVCQEGYLQIQGVCQMDCHYSCLTCRKPNSKLDCLSCDSSKILIQNSCQRCPNGQFPSQNYNTCLNCVQNCQICSSLSSCSQCLSGYFLDQNMQCQKIECHYSCQLCTGNSYSECLQCNETRKLVPLEPSSQIHLCECREGYSENNQSKCQHSQIQQNLQHAFGISALVVYSLTTLLSISDLNPVILFGLVELNQSLSYMSFINDIPALGFDQMMNLLSYNQITNLFDFSYFSENNSGYYNLRILESNQKNNLNKRVNTVYNNSTDSIANKKVKMNPKLIIFLEQSFTYLSSVILITLNASALVLACLFSYFKVKDQYKGIIKIKRIFCISLPLLVLYFTSQDLALLVFNQFQSFIYSNKQDVTDSILQYLKVLQNDQKYQQSLAEITIKNDCNNQNKNTSQPANLENSPQAKNEFFDARKEIYQDKKENIFANNEISTEKNENLETKNQNQLKKSDSIFSQNENQPLQEQSQNNKKQKIFSNVEFQMFKTEKLSEQINDQIFKSDIQFTKNESIKQKSESQKDDLNIQNLTKTISIESKQEEPCQFATIQNMISKLIKTRILILLLSK